MGKRSKSDVSRGSQKKGKLGQKLAAALLRFCGFKVYDIGNAQRQEGFSQPDLKICFPNGDHVLVEVKSWGKGKFKGVYDLMKESPDGLLMFKSSYEDWLFIAQIREKACAGREMLEAWSRARES